MDQQLVSTWLQLPLVDWPPDHYTLLGLKPGEGDLARIEQQVYQRMEMVRRYQLTHPELATEVMNRLQSMTSKVRQPRSASSVRPANHRLATHRTRGESFETIGVASQMR